MQNSDNSESILQKSLLFQKYQDERIKLCEDDFEAFCFSYLPEHFSKAPSELHRDLFKELQEAINNGKVDNIAKAAPRGNAKSTIVSLALPIWCAVYKKKNYILIVSDTADQADDFLVNIRNEIEDNQILFDDFGELIGEVWTNSNLILANGVRIQSLGAGKKVRGRKYRQHRPDLIICDDLENDENIASADQRKKNEAWFFKALSKAGDETTDKIYIGTILHYDSLLSKVLKNPAYHSKKYQAVIAWSNSSLWEEWEKMICNLENPNRLIDAERFFLEHKEEMLAGTEVLWPEKEDYYNLMLQKVSDGPAAFSSEKQNEPLSDDERRFLPEWIRYYDQDEIIGKDLYILGAVDPSMGKQGGDYSAVIILGIDANGIIYILHADLQKRHPDLIVSDVIGIYRQFHFKIFGVEEVQFQEYFKDTLAKKLEEEKLDVIVRGIKTHSDKILRIQSLQPDIKSGRVRFRRDQQKLIEQLVNFPSADHDDGPDALELALSLVNKRSSILEYYKEQAHESKKPTIQSFLQNPTLQRI